VILLLVFVPNLIGKSCNSELQTKFLQAKELFKKNHIEEAEKLILEVLNQYSETIVNPEYRFLFGKILMARGDFIGAKDNLDIVRQTKFSSIQDPYIREKQNSMISEIDRIQAIFDAEGEKKIAAYWKNQKTKSPLELADMLYKALKLSPKLIRRYPYELQKAVDVYEKVLSGKKFEPSEQIMRLAFFYSHVDKKSDAAKIYLNLVNQARSFSEEYVFIHKFDNISMSLSTRHPMVEGIEPRPDQSSWIQTGKYSNEFFDNILGNASWRELSQKDQLKIWKVVQDSVKQSPDKPSLDECGKIAKEIKTKVTELREKGELLDAVRDNE